VCETSERDGELSVIPRFGRTTAQRDEQLVVDLSARPEAPMIWSVLEEIVRPH